MATLTSDCFRLGCFPIGSMAVNPNNFDASRRRLDVLGLGCTAVDELLYVQSIPLADGKARVLRSANAVG
jgi:hypothetical protein